MLSKNVRSVIFTFVCWFVFASTMANLLGFAMGLAVCLCFAGLDSVIRYYYIQYHYNNIQYFLEQTINRAIIAINNDDFEEARRYRKAYNMWTASVGWQSTLPDQ